MSTTENRVGGRCAGVVRGEEHHPSVNGSSSNAFGSCFDRSSEARTCLACIQLGVMPALRGRPPTRSATPVVQRRVRGTAGPVRRCGRTTGACTPSQMRSTGARRRRQGRAQPAAPRRKRSDASLTSSSTPVSGVVEHAGFWGRRARRFCGSSSTLVLRFWVRVIVDERAQFWVRAEHAGSRSACDGGDGHTRLPRGNSSTFLWTTDLDRDRSVEDRSAACQPDSRERRIVVAIHRGRSHWCSSPRPGDHAVAVTGALHRDWW
jgi:hypothetical protein